MKEATGELNMSLVVISSVAILSAFFFTVLWPLIDKGQEAQANCSKAICEKNADSNGMVECHLKGETDTFKCKYKG